MACGGGGGNLKRHFPIHFLLDLKEMSLPVGIDDVIGALPQFLLGFALYVILHVITHERCIIGLEMADRANQVLVLHDGIRSLLRFTVQGSLCEWCSKQFLCRYLAFSGLHASSRISRKGNDKFVICEIPLVTCSADIC